MLKEETPNVNVFPSFARIPKTAWEALVEKHREVWYRRSIGGAYEFLLRCPSDFAFRRYQVEQREGKAEWDAAEELAMDCVLWPEKDDAVALFERRPMLKKAVAEWGAMIGAGAFDAVEKKA
jgi:hypothetical protein